MSINGCDISEFQGVLDWDQLAREKDFVIIRAGFGNGGRDSQFTRNQAEARRVGIPHWFYWYTYPMFGSGPVQASAFKSVVGTLETGEGMAFDFEEHAPDPVGWLGAAVDTGVQLWGFPSPVYLNRSELGAFDWGPVIRRNCGLWLALLDATDPSSIDLHGWPFAAVVQGAQGPIPGEAGGSIVDLDTFNGTADQFRAYGLQGAAPAPPPPPPPTPAPPPPATGSYTVQPGDSLSAIAAKFGMTWQQLYAFGNNAAVVGPNPNAIFPGQVLAVPHGQPAPAPPPAAPTTQYVVRSGDSLSGIAARFGWSWSQLWNFGSNRSRIANPNLIFPGEIIDIP